MNPISFTRIVSGITDYSKETTQPDGAAFIRHIDYRSDPRRWTLLPKSQKESGSVITDLPMWADRVGNDTYILGNSGKLYKRTIAGSVTLVNTAPNSSGNGLKYFGEDDFLYYMSDKVLGRYGRISGTPSFSDDFLGAQGGVPTNTHSLDLEASSSRYATAADHATLSITGDISMETWRKFESIPAIGDEMVLMSKWNENSNQRSYKFTVTAVSGSFGDGSDGALTISSNTTEAPIDSACSGTSGANTLSATNASFAANQEILIHQTRGTGAGTWQRNKIASYTSGTITLENALNFSYNSTGANKAQVRVLKQYSAVTIDSGFTYTTKAWDGTVGGIIGWLCDGTTTVTGSLVASGGTGGSGTGNGLGVSGGTGGGFRGGRGGDESDNQKEAGEGTAGAAAQQNGANGNGGGGGTVNGSSSAGGGGGHATSGANGNTTSGGGAAGTGGGTAGSADLTTMVFGGGGGGGGRDVNDTNGGGGSGGGIVFLTSETVTVTGAVRSNGGAGGDASTGGGTRGASGGGGAGGSILINGGTVTLGSSLVTATGGAAGNANSTSIGGAGGSGRIHINYSTGVTGTSSPNYSSSLDTSLEATSAYQLRLYVSSNGTNSETYKKNLDGLATGIWRHFAVTWDASASTAEFYDSGVSIGTSTGAFTAIFDSTALFAIGASFNGAGSAEDFYDGLTDENRIYSDIRTAQEIAANKDSELLGTDPNLEGYYQHDNALTDDSPNANTLTLVNSPVYSTDVPFSGATTRVDKDQESADTGDTYSLATAIDEDDKQEFVPAKDPQKSIAVYVNTKGTGNWTLYVHDAQNRLIASKTIANADLPASGAVEFVFDTVWRPIIGATYHFHVTSTVADGVIVADSNEDMGTAQFVSYYQFLVEDIYHPVEQITNLLAIGNERYVATWDGGTYNPHRLTLPAGWRVRCFGLWREYIAIGCWKGSAIDSYDQGIIFFWDGISDTYNFYQIVPEGAINALFGSQGTLSIIAGYKGDLLEYTGGDKAVKVKKIPKVDVGKKIEVYPGALTMWQTLLRIGAGSTDSDEVEQGVYTWGRLNTSYVDSLSFDFAISTLNTQSSSVKVGMLFPVAQKLLVGWGDNMSYGLDSIDLTSTSFQDGSIEFMIRDEGGVWKEKLTKLVRADFEPIVSGHTVGIQYKLDRSSSWSTEQTQTTAATDTLRVQLKNGRHREYQVRLNVRSTTTTSPAIIGVTVDEDILNKEKLV